MSAVCEQCVEEPALQKFVRDNAYNDECDYCGSKGECIATDVGELGAFILEAVGKEYVDPAEELPYETREGGYQGDVIDSPWELFEEIGFWLSNEQLMEDLGSSLGADVWLCRRDYFQLTHGERLNYGWQRFCQVVKHQRRYTFWSAYDDDEDEYHPDYLPTANVLKEVAAEIRSARLVKPLKIESQLWRARIHDAARELKAAKDFASPPTEVARYSNRMSPAGISMFYGAEAAETAVAEVLGSRPLEAGKVVSAAVFHPTSQLMVLDLVELPRAPSFFDDQDDIRHAVYFLRQFAREVSKPVAKDGREHIEYVPTQAFCEYVRTELDDGEGNGVDGVRYTSAQNGKPCFVIFADHDACVSVDGNRRRGSEQVLTFAPESLRQWTPDDVGQGIKG